MKTCKEDLIGVEWICPECAQPVKITNTGIDHNCDDYMICRPLSKFW